LSILRIQVDQLQEFSFSISDVSHDKISRDKAAFAVRDGAILALKETYPGELSCSSKSLASFS